MMTVFPPDSSLILVAIMPNPRDLDIARMLGWYRIPLRTAPKIIAADYLGFYQTGKFNTIERWQIHHFAAMKGYELTTRSRLFQDEKDHPRSNEEYYKIQLGEVQQLDTPILAEGWRRVTFFYTTGDLFKQAEIMNDLIVRDEERKVLWKSLRDRAEKNAQYSTDKSTDLPIEPELQALLGLLYSK